MDQNLETEIFMLTIGKKIDVFLSKGTYKDTIYTKISTLKDSFINQSVLAGLIWALFDSIGYFQLMISQSRFGSTAKFLSSRKKNGRNLKLLKIFPQVF